MMKRVLSLFLVVVLFSLGVVVAQDDNFLTDEDGVPSESGSGGGGFGVVDDSGNDDFEDDNGVSDGFDDQIGDGQGFDDFEKDGDLLRVIMLLILMR